MTKYKIHVPTMEFGFIEAEFDTAEEALAEHDRIRFMAKAKEGLGIRDWAQFRDNFYLHQVLDPDDQEKMEKLSRLQRHVINEMKLAIRSNKGEE